MMVLNFLDPADKAVVVMIGLFRTRTLPLALFVNVAVVFPTAILLALFVLVLEMFASVNSNLMSL
jgi:hypothetical protein